MPVLALEALRANRQVGDIALRYDALRRSNRSIFERERTWTMAQLTVRLPEEIDHGLAATAERMERKRAEVVRMAFRRFLELNEEGKPADRVQPLFGSLESGVPDLAENHRRYVLEALRRGP